MVRKYGRQAIFEAKWAKDWMDQTIEAIHFRALEDVADYLEFLRQRGAFEGNLPERVTEIIALLREAIRDDHARLQEESQRLEAEFDRANSSVG